MLTLFKLVLVVLAGTALGLALTYEAVHRGVAFNAVKVGAWVGVPTNGGLDVGPYARATLARTAEMPLGNAEGLSFIARTDSAGETIRPACDYIVSGTVPPTRYWTLSVLSPSGFPIANPDQRYGFTSAEIVRAADGTFQIDVAHDARPGNWLPVGRAKAYVLMLRLYDTLLDVGTTKLGSAAMPKIFRGHCA